MTDENRLASIEKKLDEHGHTANTLAKIAVQEERIKNVESQQTTLWRKYDALVDPNNGQLPRIMNHQASCPRAQIKFLWWFVATVDFGLLIILLGCLLK